MGRPESIRTILPSVLRGLQEEGNPREKIKKLLRQCLGAKGAKARMEGYRRKQLTVSVENSSLLHELSLQKEELLRKFRETLGEGVVEEIRFRIGVRENGKD